MVRQRFVSALVVAIACLDAALANASQPSASALEEQAQAEFAKAGTAVRERLDREAAGDLIGARIAAQDAEAHRYRYLDIKRELNRQHSPSLASPSVEAPRDPFLPDASFLAPSASSRLGSRPMTAGRPERGYSRRHTPRGTCIGLTKCGPSGRPKARNSTKNRGRHPLRRPWDGPRTCTQHGVAKPTSGDRGAVATDLSASAPSGEPPREPFLVYRERLAGSDSRE